MSDHFKTFCKNNAISGALFGVTTMPNLETLLRIAVLVSIVIYNLILIRNAVRARSKGRSGDEPAAQNL